MVEAKRRGDRRDDFTLRTKRILASRVGWRCSNPSCRALTVGPSSDPASSVSVGVAAHITAAARGGPRYDPKLPREKRAGLQNGIWLCEVCGKLVDVDAAVVRGISCGSEVWSDERFEYSVGDGTFPSETWFRGVTVFMNPHALIPLPEGLLPCTSTFRIVDGRLVRDVHGFHPLTVFMTMSGASRS